MIDKSGMTDEQIEAFNELSAEIKSVFDALIPKIPEIWNAILLFLREVYALIKHFFRLIATEQMIIEGWTPWVARLRSRLLPFDEVLLIAQRALE